MLFPPASTTTPILLCTSSAATSVCQLSRESIQALRIAQYTTQDQPQECLTIYDGLTFSESAQLVQALTGADDYQHFALLTARDITSPLHTRGQAQATERPTATYTRVNQSASASSARGPVILSVMMRVHDGADAIELDRWYEEEHVGLLARIPGWKRTTRWLRIAAHGGAWKGESDDEIELLALHEFEAQNELDGPEHLASKSTKWRDRAWTIVRGSRRRVLKLEE